MENNRRTGEKGYTLLFAVLTAATVLGVAVFILSESRGQYLLASTARESTFAIYAADSGIECAALVAGNLSTTTPATANMDCAGHTVAGNNTNIIPAFKSDGSDSVTVSGLYRAQKELVTIDLGGGRCAAISFIKGVDDATHTISITQIESHGYNFCTNSGGSLAPDASNPKIVERAIRLTYTGI